jgi:tryptophanyl-tRNA synthetase
VSEETGFEYPEDEQEAEVQLNEQSGRKRIFSGIQPTGDLHIGNYLGAVRHWVALQEQYDCIYSIVDLHAITQDFDAREMPARVFELARGLMACGLDPEVCSLFVQSTVPEHTELTWILNTITPIGLLSRMTQFKDKSEGRSESVGVGLFDYPVLQAADIILYKAHAVPVGEDQQQHLEFTRDLVRKFNLRYGETFPEPRTLLSEVPRVLGFDGERKMSKSLENHIALTDTPDEVWKKIAPAKTDIQRKRRSDPGRPEVCNIFSYHKFFSSDEEQAWAREGCTTAMIGCLDCKKVVAGNINTLLAPIRDRYARLESAPGMVDEALAAGTARLRPIARETIAEVREKMGLTRPERDGCP